MILPFSENSFDKMLSLPNLWETVSVFTPSFEFRSTSVLSYPHQFPFTPSLPRPIYYLDSWGFFFPLDLYRIRLEHIQALLETKCFGACYFGNFSFSA